MRRSVQRVFLVIIILTMVSLACNIGGLKGKATDEVAVEETEVKKTAASNEKEEADETPQLGEEKRSEEGGYSYRVIPNYTDSSDIGITSMIAPDGNEENGPIVMIIGGLKDEGSNAESLVEDMKSSNTADITFSNQRETSVDGAKAIALDYSGSNEGVEVAGSMVIGTNDTQQIVVIATAPKARWKNELSPLFEAVVKSIKLFEPTEITYTEPTLSEIATEAVIEPTSNVESTAQMQTMHQWAALAVASSEYGADNWSANQASGEPDSLDCSDSTTAWASLSVTDYEWIELYYTDFVIPSEINIYQNYYPDQVIKVEVVGESGTEYEVYVGNPYEVSTCPYILSIPVTTIDEYVSIVRITLDQTYLNYWTEIDAVELVGTTTNTLSAEPQATIDPDFDFTMFTFNQIPMEQVDPGTMYCEVVRGEEDMIVLENLTVTPFNTEPEYQLFASNVDPEIIITIVIPKNYTRGQMIEVIPYLESTPGEDPTASIYAIDGLFTAYNGWMNVTDKDGLATGGIMYLSNSEGNPMIVETRCLFNQVPLEAK